MNTKKIIHFDPEKLSKLQQQVWKIARSKGWHEKRFSPFHWLCLVMTELSEAVEADRKNRRAKTSDFEEVFCKMKKEYHSETDSIVYKNFSLAYKTNFSLAYNQCIKDSVEEEFADIVIRLLDIACEFYGEGMKWQDREVTVSTFCTFSEKAFYFVRQILDYDMAALSHSIAYMYQWAEQEGINLDKQIEWKMKYNEFRPYKHGGKKY